MKAQDPRFKEKVEKIFSDAPFLQNLGIQLMRCEPGWIETGLEVRPMHLQQNGMVHAGVLATLADHSAGGAAGSLMRPDQIVLTVEFKINFLRPAVGERLRCSAKALKPGKTLTIVESEVWCSKEGADKLCAKAMVTLALVENFENPS